MIVQAICVSRDEKWIVCGTEEQGASVWDGELRKEAIHVEGKNMVNVVDVAADSTRFATGTSRNKEASIWNILTGRRLVGPLKHDSRVSGVRFSLSGERIATACFSGIRIFDSHTGDKLVTISTDQPGWGAITPIEWSSDTQRIFAASRDRKIKVFDASTGTQLAESQTLHGNNDVPCVALAANGKFVAAFADCSISFIDTSTLARIGPIVEDGDPIWSVNISPDSTCLASGRRDGKIAIHDLGKILPDRYGPFGVSILPLYSLHVEEALKH